MYHNSGFTLIELLVVVMIVAVLSAVVAPVAYKGVEKFDHLIATKKKIDINRAADYLSFITDSSCNIKGKGIVCGGSKERLYFNP